MIRFIFGADIADFDKKTGSIKAQLKQLRDEGNQAAEKMGKAMAVGGIAAAAGMAKMVSASIDAVKTQQEMITAADGAQKQLLLAAQAAQKYGNNLSTLDLNSVMNASIAIEDMTDMATGFSKQLTANMSPAIQAVAKALEGATEEAGGMGAMADKAFNYIVDGAAFAVNAADGVDRAFTLTADGIIAAFSGVSSGIATALSELLHMANAVPGIELDGVIESIDQFATQAGKVAMEAVDHASETMNKKMAGDTLKGWIAEAELTADYTRNLTKEEIKILGEKEIARQEAVKKESDDEKRRKEEYIANLNEKLQALRDSGKTENDLLDEKLNNEIALLDEAYQAKQVQSDEYDALKQESYGRYNDALLEQERVAAEESARIDKEREDAKKQAMSDTFSNLSVLMNTGSKKLFEVGKAAAIAGAIMSTYQAASNALAQVPYPFNIAAASSMVVAGMANVANIKSQTMNGGGGGGGGATPTQQINNAATPVQQQRNISISVSGEGVSDSSRSLIRDLISQLNENVGDNVKLGMK